MAGHAEPDAGDVHAPAAAIAGHADCRVTTNLKDFPAQVLRPCGIEAIHPDGFIAAQIWAARRRVSAAPPSAQPRAAPSPR